MDCVRDDLGKSAQRLESGDSRGIVNRTAVRPDKLFGDALKHSVDNQTGQGTGIDPGWVFPFPPKGLDMPRHPVPSGADRLQPRRAC